MGGRAQKQTNQQWYQQRSKKRKRYRFPVFRSRMRTAMVGSGTGRGENCVFRSRPQLRDPVPTSISFPTVYYPDLWHLVPIPTISRPAVNCIPDFSRPAPPSAQLFPFHPDVRTHFVPSRNSLEWKMSPSHSPCMGCIIYFHVYGCNWIIPIWIIQTWMQ